jgi:Phage major capsid protein E
MELSLDILRNDTFSYVNLQRVAGNTTYVPTTLGMMNLFEPEPIIGEVVHLYEEDQVIRLVPTTERGTPDTRMLRDVGRLRALKTTRLSQIDSIRASELVGMANMALPQTIRVRTAQDLIARRTAKMKRQLEFTKELHRFGGIQGKLLDADGTTVIADFFDIFGLNQPALINFDFAGLAEEELLQFIQDTFLRPTQIAMQDSGRWTPNTYYAAIVGDTFWAKLMQHPGFRRIYQLVLTATAEAAARDQLTKPNMWNVIDFAGVRWINYQGTRNNAIAVPTNEARFFPVGAVDVFKVYWGSGETMLDVTNPGQPEYLYVQPDVRTNIPEYVDTVLRSYPLYACIFPKALSRAQIAP